jgi:hypothetical protein
MSAFPKIVEKIGHDRCLQNYRIRSFTAWEEAQISAGDRERFNRSGWEDMIETREGNNTVPFDCLDLTHRPAIEQAMSWIQDLALTRGEEVSAY